MIALFFLNRRVLAGTISLLLLLLGAVSLYQLPVEQCPQITPPTIRVTTVYPGASAQVVADTVAAPIEQQISGVEGMLYMSSTSAADGTYALTVTFDIDTDLDKAQALIQNRLTIAEAQLPEEVQRQGLVVTKQTAGVMMVVSLTSDDPSHDELFLANYATLRVRDELARIPGVGEVQVYGAGAYSMRVWLDPDKLHAYSLTTKDVVNALGQQNMQAAAGQIGQPPAPDGSPFQLSVTAPGRLTDPAEFERVIVKTGPGSEPVFLKDIASVELGGLSYDTFTRHEERDAAAVLVYQLPGSNALDVARGVREVMNRLAEKFPSGVRHGYPYDSTPFVDAAIHEVYRTLIEAGVLVLVVILLFLGSWRATLVPATTVPVTIVGAFAFMYLLGFSINLLTLFGLVLAIGIVVDDAIVIVEAVTRHIEKGLSPREATLRAMKEVTGPILGITLVLMAVFIPASFLQGTTGRMYQQFALTIAATALLSALNAITLKPVQSATWLRAAKPHKNLFSRAFSNTFLGIQSAYVSTVRQLVRVPLLVLALTVPLILFTAWSFSKLPSGFLPADDQGYGIVVVQLPNGASLERTRVATDEVSKVLAKTPGVETWMTLGGYSLLDGANAPNTATLFVMFTPFEARKGRADLSQHAILGSLNNDFRLIRDANAFAIAPPAMIGLGVAGGFELQVEDREGVGLDEVQSQTSRLLDSLQGASEIGSLSANFRAGVPQLEADINREKVHRLDLTMDDVFGTLQTALGSVYVNDFNKFGRTFQVRVQASAASRDEPEDMLRLSVRNRQGEMVPLGSVLSVRESFGPQFVKRYNTYPAISVFGSAPPGKSSGPAMAAIEHAAGRTLPATIGLEWTGLAFEEKRVGGQYLVVFAFTVTMVFIVLAPLYESRVLPFAILLTTPLGLLGVASAALFAGIEFNVYVQIGAVLIVALASKNAILIVEFAREMRLDGKSITEAAIEAAKERLRPVLMTSIAFIAGVVPLVLAEGAGAASRRSLGIAVFGGMITSTVLAVYFVPVAYVIAQRIDEMFHGTKWKTIATSEFAGLESPDRSTISAESANGIKI
ncbi:MAG: multidrug efflux RND transporter permease subunit [Pirellulaceae bacterium]|nr:multidrug efflux RND transporter permease subunit [Pirellulaceae bacterium]